MKEDVKEQAENGRKAAVMRRFSLPLSQYYDGNIYNPRKYTPGHLFENSANISLCGIKKAKMSAPVFERKYSSVQEIGILSKCCLKCKSVAAKNAA